MKIFDCYNAAPAIEADAFQICCENGGITKSIAALQKQHHVSILINDIVAFSITCTPEHLVELALGRMFSDGIISSCNDVDQIHVCKQGDVLKVKLNNKAPLELGTPVKIDTCNAVRESHLASTNDETLPPVTPIHFNKQWIFALAHEFAQDTPMHKKTRGAHSCFLAVGDSILFFCEDLGRHNAFDKAIGWALRHDVDMSRCIVITSGRVPTDMAIKAIRAGIPILLSASVPTNEALALARQKSLTLIGQIKDGQVSVFHDPTQSMSRPLIQAVEVNTLNGPALASELISNNAVNNVVCA